MYKKVFGALNIDTEKFTHASRGVAARRLRKVSEGDSGMVVAKGNWADSNDGDAIHSYVLQKYVQFPIVLAFSCVYVHTYTHDVDVA